MHRRGWFTCHLRAISHRRISLADIAATPITGLIGTIAAGRIILTFDTSVGSVLARSVLESPCRVTGSKHADRRAEFER